MFRIVVLAVALNGIMPSTGWSQDELTLEPYSVFVAEEESYAYCGPSEEYYRTDPLRYGQTLDVYAETEDGWLGVRPPEDSFCWIPADAVELVGAEDEGTIVEDRTVAWIGTHLGRARKYRWQVQLAKGEPVTVIGRSEREGPDGPQLWYRIVPPSGEYRWVHRDSVVMSSEELVESVRQRADGNASRSVASQTPADSASNTVASGSRLEAPPSTPVTEDNPNTRTISGRDAVEEETVATSGESILNRDEAIGSGLNEAWRNKEADQAGEVIQTSAIESPQTAMDAFKQGGLLASLEFLTRPRIQEIGGQPQTAPHAAEVAGDSNWVAGATRGGANQPALAAADLGVPVTPQAADPTRYGEIQQASAQSDLAAPGAWQAVAPAAHSFHVVPAERISQIEAEAREADLDRLNLILSRLMAAQASAAETEPVERAARHLASTASDPVVGGRARMLAETAERYRRIATRRDGHSVIQTNATIPANTIGADLAARPASVNALATSPPSLSTPSPAMSNPAPAQLAVVPSPSMQGSASQATSVQGNSTASGGVINETGFLVQVYSARSNSPPFALTDNAGRTVAYVTPAPGVNLRTHLNSRINVVGSRGYLTGLNTPHILATQAVRTPE